MITAAALGFVTAVWPFLAALRRWTCDACGRDVWPGHTAYCVETSRGPANNVCWECGEAIAAHCGITTVDDPFICPPYGGGAHPRKDPGRPAGVS